MPVTMKEWFKAYARGRGIAMAKQFERKLKEKLSTPAATYVTPGGRVVPLFPAQPFAPPREVTGELKQGVKMIRTKTGARVQVIRGTNRKIPWWLERGTRTMRTPHPFFNVVLEEMGLA